VTECVRFSGWKTTCCTGIANGSDDRFYFTLDFVVYSEQDSVTVNGFFNTLVEFICSTGVLAPENTTAESNMMATPVSITEVTR
jgi:hypothetical protein